VLVAQAGRTRGQAIVQAKEILLRAQARVLGVVLNKVKDSAVQYRRDPSSSLAGAATPPKLSSSAQVSARVEP
jgi:Mrp family chromosome partitioning ATPase